MRQKINCFCFLLFLFIVVSFSFQCYKTINHPIVNYPADSTGYYYSKEITPIDDCSSCHKEELNNIESNFDIYNEPIYYQNYNWNYFFVTPWWYDQSYYEQEEIAQEQENLRPPDRNFGRGAAKQSPLIATPNQSRPALAKPTSESTSPKSDAKPPTRNVKRQTETNVNNKSKQNSIKPPPKSEVKKKQSKKSRVKKTKK